MKFFAIYFLNLLCYLTKCECYRVLGLNPLNGKSHFIMFEKLYKELASRGHEVDVLSHFPQEKKIPRYTDFSLKNSLPNIVGNMTFDLVGKLTLPKSMEIATTLCGAEICTSAFNHPVVSELKHSNKKYDLIITELFGTDCMFGFAHHFDVPVVTMTTSVNVAWGSTRFGNPDDPNYIPNYFSTYSPKMNVIEKIWNTLYLIYERVYFYIYSTRASDKLVKDFFGEDTPHINDLIEKYSSLHLVNSHFSFNQARPWVPNVIEVGGLHVDNPKPLHDKHKDLINLENKYKGVIFMSFGSLLVLDSVPVDRLKVLFDSFALLPDYKFLVKGDRLKMPNEVTISPNVHMESWIPQRDVLDHPNIVLFISHGGLMGTEEAVQSGVPLLMIPLFGDQFVNAKYLTDKGAALELSLADLTREKLLDTISDLVNNPKFRESMKKTSYQFQDRPMSAIDTAIYWIEYVVRHKGAKQLRSVASEMTFIEYYYIDIILSVFIPLYVLIKLPLIINIKKLIVGSYLQQ